jgi:eukaryotic-like serine/threonine-protein kinase
VSALRAGVVGGDRRLGPLPGCLLQFVIDDSPPPSVGAEESLEETAYRLHRLDLVGALGQGGMGVVYEAEQPDLDRNVALKVLREEHAGDPDVRRRFVEEARVGGRLQHPGVVSVYSLGELGDRPFFTMRLVRGRTLAEHLRAGADPAWALGAFLQVCQAVAYAHDRRVIHRDLKPSNIMVGDFGEVQVVDWGVARRLRSTPETAGAPGVEPPGLSLDDSDTRAGSVVGTPAYMSPEQARGEPASHDERSDVFGLGATLCEILTGKPPYLGESREEVARKAREGELTGAIERIGACDADPELKALTRDCLARIPEARPRHAGEVAARVQAYQARVRQSRKDAREACVRAEVRAHEARRRSVLTLALVVLCALLAAWWVTDRERKARRTAETVRSVEEALAEAGRLRQQGRSLETRSALRNVEGLLAQSDAGVRARFTTTLADFAMLARLDDARYFPFQLGPGRLLPAQAAAAYADAFRDYGIDPLALSAVEAAARVRRSAIRLELVAALDDWGRVTPSRSTRVRLRDLSEAADPDPDGPAARLRRALARPDRATLGALARSVDAQIVSAGVLASLGAALRDQRALDESAEVLHAAQKAHPDDFWINLELATTLSARAPDPPAEARAYLTAALALSRNNPGVYFYQAAALQGLGRLDAAAASYRDAIALQPDYPEAYCNLGNTLTRQGKTDEAVAAFRRAIALRPDYALAFFNLGYALDEQEKYADAIEAYREAVRFRSDYAEAHCNLGLAAYRLGRFSEAVPAFEQGVGLVAASDPLRPMFEKMLAMARSLAALEPRLDATLGRRDLADVGLDDLLGFARLCAWKNRELHAHAARFYTEAFQRSPDLAENLEAGDRYAAAGSAAAAGTGRGADAASLTAVERAALRRQALAWLRADLARRRDQLAHADPAARRDVLTRLRYWLREPLFAGVRDPAIGALPEPERADWRALWSDHAAAVKGSGTVSGGR